MYYPIFAESSDRIEWVETYQNGTTIDHSENAQVVAIFALAFYWRDTIKDILPTGSDGMVVVFSNPCNPSFSYQINGPDVEYLGYGDLHDPKYDSLSIGSYVTDLRSFAIQDSFYSGLPLSDFCPMYVEVYASETMEANHTTSTPIIFAVVAALVFIATALTFVLYDFYVERRQRVVMTSAAKSSAIITSLFPEHVAKKLEEQLPDDIQPKNRLKTFLNDGKDRSYSSGSIDNEDDGNVVTKAQSKQIAELFPDTTVFFCDIVGFTAWSSVREPCHVFTLLETVYASFGKFGFVICMQTVFTPRLVHSHRFGRGCRQSS
jgi:hypothetical protein